VRFLLVHHTASPNGADPIGTMRGVYNFHTSAEKGWPDVAYNFFVDQNGVVYEARTGSLAGPVEASATGGSQGFAQLVCLLGDFTSQNPTDAALASLNEVLAWLADRYAIDTSPGATTTFVSRGSNRWPQGSTVTASTISGHRDMSQTACPGDTFYPYLVANVQQQVHALRGGGQPTTTAAPEPTTTPEPSTTTTTTTTTAPSTTTPETTSAATAVSETAPETTTSETTPATSSATIAATSEPSQDTAAAPVADTAAEPPAVDRSAIEAPVGAGNATGRNSSNGAAVAVAAGAAVVAATGALYVGMRGRGEDGTPDGGDPLAPRGGGPDPVS
jgi:hypothetical protein